MWGLWRWPLLAAISLTLLAAPSAAAASRPPADEPVLVSGSLTYTWQGDPARGCALEGLCNVVGSVIFDPDPGGGDVSFFGGRTVGADLTGTATARARRGMVGLGGADCTDLELDVDQSLELPIKAHGLAAIDDPCPAGAARGRWRANSARSDSASR